MAEILPGIFASDWQSFSDMVSRVGGAVPWIHVDILDGTIASTVTLTDFSGLPSLRTTYPGCQFEGHLMVANPEKYIRPLVDAGFTRLIAHVESNDPRRFLSEARFEEVEVGLAIDGTTDVTEIEPFLEEVDFVVVQSAEAGGPNRPFLPESLEMVKTIRQSYPDLVIEVIGGIDDTNIASVKEAGATRIVSTHFVFQNPGNELSALDLLSSR